ncbi:MAG: FkbM family methyltransferase [Chitinophagales bacterium]|nr:FkbM family methyltransferase [Chitinophagales bacterium]
MNRLSDIYRSLPPFKGKKRIGSFLFRNIVYKKSDRLISCKNGLKFHLLNTQDSVGRDLFFDGEYEPETVRLICSLLEDDDIMVDAGANIGAISLPIAKKKNITIYAFEPGKHIHEILKKNIEINGIRNVYPQQTALSDSAGEIAFYESDRVHGWSGPVKIDSFQHYKVPCTTLDTFTADLKIDRIKVLKADVQGWEYHVFKGAEQLLKEGRIRHIIFEFEWWAEKNAGLELGAAQKLLMQHGYRLETLEGKELATPLTEGTKILHAWKE